MKKVLLLALLIVMLTGCGHQNNQLDRALALRQQMLQADRCSFDAHVTADYGDSIYTFSMHCIADDSGSLNFEVQEPESISGITGTVAAHESKLTFDGQVLTFAPIADGQITPVIAPWIMINTLKGGYLNACTTNSTGLMLCIDDSYQEDALTLNIQLDANDLPLNAEILWKGRRVVSVEVSNFTIM